MRRTLAIVPALVLLTACGGSDEEPTAAATTSPAASSQFCTAAGGIQARIAASFGGETDRTILPMVFQEAASEIRATEPPAELAEDWSAFADGVQQIADAAQIDFGDPAAVATFQREVAAAQRQYGEAFGTVTTYLTEECGLVEAPTGTSAPTS
jgi:hypothetical protein